MTALVDLHIDTGQGTGVELTRAAVSADQALVLNISEVTISVMRCV